jgi:hydroxymethylbilane synthase
MPLAAFATFSGEHLKLRAAWGDPDGAAVLVRAQMATAAADLDQATKLGTEVAAQLRAGGAH